MKCHICDATIANPTVSSLTGKYEPCNTCIQASSLCNVDRDEGEILTDDDLSLLEASAAEGFSL